MSVLDTTKQSSCNHCIDTWQWSYIVLYSLSQKRVREQERARGGERQGERQRKRQRHTHTYKIPSYFSDSGESSSGLVADSRAACRHWLRCSWTPSVPRMGGYLTCKTYNHFLPLLLRNSCTTCSIVRTCVSTVPTSDCKQLNTCQKKKERKRLVYSHRHIYYI